MGFDYPEEQHVEGKYARELFYIIIRSLNVFLFAHCNQITLFIIKMRNRFILKPIELKVSSSSGPISRGG